MNNFKAIFLVGLLNLSGSTLANTDNPQNIHTRLVARMKAWEENVKAEQNTLEEALSKEQAALTARHTTERTHFSNKTNQECNEIKSAMKPENIAQVIAYRKEKDKGKSEFIATMTNELNDKEREAQGFETVMMQQCPHDFARSMIDASKSTSLDWGYYNWHADYFYGKGCGKIVKSFNDLKQKMHAETQALSLINKGSITTAELDQINQNCSLLKEGFPTRDEEGDPAVISPASFLESLHDQDSWVMSTVARSNFQACKNTMAAIKERRESQLERFNRLLEQSDTPTAM